MPMEIRHASEEFERFLNDAREISGLATLNQTYTMTEGVFRTFRKRLSAKDAIAFAGILPPVLRAIFVADWDVDAPLVPFGARSDWVGEAQSVRKDHNFAPESCIEDVAAALRRHVDEAAFDDLLATLPSEAGEFWRASGGH